MARSIERFCQNGKHFSQNVLAKVADTQDLRKELRPVRKLARECARAITLRIPQLKDGKNHFDKKKEKGKGTMVFICEDQSAVPEKTAKYANYANGKVFRVFGLFRGCRFFPT